MNVIASLDQYDPNCVMFCDPIKNNIVNNGVFIRITYANEWFTLNGIYLDLNIECYSTEKYYNKYKCYFDTCRYQQLINKLRTIEKTLLELYEPTGGQIAQYKIFDQIKGGIIKVFDDNYTNVSVKRFVLKIAGIWVTDCEYGVTYKFQAI